MRNLFCWSQQISTPLTMIMPGQKEKKGTPKEQALEQKKNQNEQNPIYYKNIVREEKGFPQRGYNYSVGD